MEKLSPSSHKDIHEQQQQQQQHSTHCSFSQTHTRLLTRINPRDEMCQKLTSQVKNEHDEEKNAKTQSSMRLANTGETLKVIAVLELTKLFINLIKALLESDLGTFSSEKRWFFGCHGRIVVLERKEKRGVINVE